MIQCLSLSFFLVACIYLLFVVNWFFYFSHKWNHSAFMYGFCSMEFFLCVQLHTQKWWKQMKLFTADGLNIALKLCTERTNEPTNESMLHIAIIKLLSAHFRRIVWNLFRTLVEFTNFSFDVCVLQYIRFASSPFAQTTMPKKLPIPSTLPYTK